MEKSVQWITVLVVSSVIFLASYFKNTVAISLFQENREWNWIFPRKFFPVVKCKKSVLQVQIANIWMYFKNTTNLYLPQLLAKKKTNQEPEWLVTQPRMYTPTLQNTSTDCKHYSCGDGIVVKPSTSPLQDFWNKWKLKLKPLKNKHVMCQILVLVINYLYFRIQTHIPTVICVYRYS
jgi:hypothetical protein